MRLVICASRFFESRNHLCAVNAKIRQNVFTGDDLPQTPQSQSRCRLILERLGQRAVGLLLITLGKKPVHILDKSGFGTRVTIWEQSPKLKWGAAFQVNWNGEMEGKMKTQIDGQDTIMKYRYNFTEYQVAFGPLYKIKERVRIYGGPFLHFIRGNVRSRGEFDEGGGSVVRKYSWDIKERSILGGYIGLQIDVIKNKMPFFVEYQHTAAADMLAMNLILRF